jgi:hypothetical protein
MRKSLIAGLSTLMVICGATAASAAVITWNTWDSASSGSAGSILTTYVGPANALVTGYPSYGPTSTFADGVIVDNAPTSANNILQLVGGNEVTQTLTFSQAVVNPVFAIWSLGQGGGPASFVFDQTPTFVAGGPSNEYGGFPINVAGNTVFGEEVNGTVIFYGTYSSLSWANPQSEFWYGFNVGFESVAPEPATWFMMILGFVAVGFLAHRQRGRMPVRA